MTAQCALSAHSSSDNRADYARDYAVHPMHKADMDTAWFKARKKEVRVTDAALAEAIGRDRSLVNKIVNGGSGFDLDFVEPFARLLKVSPGTVLERIGINVDGTPPPNATVERYEGASLEEAREDLPIYGTALGASRQIEGEAIEQTDLNKGEVLEYVKRPVLLNRHPKAYGLHVQGSSMHPALPDGELLVAVPGRPLSIGDNVVVYLRPADESDDGEAARAVLVKELVRRTASYYELRQYDPPKVFRIEACEVVRVDRVLTRREMLE